MGLLSHVNSFYVFDFFAGLFRSISIIRSWSKKSPLRLHNIVELLDFVIIYAINRSHDHNNEKQNLTVVSMTTFLKKKNDLRTLYFNMYIYGESIMYFNNYVFIYVILVDNYDYKSLRIPTSSIKKLK